MRALKSLPLLAVVLAVVAGCGSEQTSTGSVQLVIGDQEFAANGSGVTRIQVTVSGSDFNSISQDLVKTGSTWGGTIEGIPAGTNRTFLAAGFTSSGTKTYEGQATGVTITAGGTAMVAINLQDLTVPVTPPNGSPVIDSLTVSSATVTVGGAVTIGATAHDNTGETLSYAWTATAGTLTNAAVANTTWTAPSTPQTVTLTCTIRDPRGGVSSARLFVEVVGAAPVGGSGTISIVFNTPPMVSVTANEGRVRLGTDTQLQANVVDVDFETVNYQWSATCAGTFTTPNSMTSKFTPTAVPSGACNNCSVTMTAWDNRGGTNSSTLHICVVPADSYAP